MGILIETISNTVRKPRNFYFDVLRGVAIVMVVGIHTSDYSVNIQTADLFFRLFMTCAVPLFIALSGYFSYKKLISNGYRRFVSHQVPKVYFPVIFWSIPLVVMGILHGFPILSVLGKTLLCGMSIYFFVAIIIQLYISSKLFTIKLGGGYHIVLHQLLVILSCGITSTFNTWNSRYSVGGHFSHCGWIFL